MTDDTIRHFTPETLRIIAVEIRNMRMRLLCDVADAGADAEAEQYFLLALAALDLAERHMTLAAYKQSQALVRHDR